MHGVPSSLLQASRHGVFTRQISREVGVSDKQLRRMVCVGEVNQEAPKVFSIPGVAEGPRKRMAIATRTVPGSAVACRSTCELYNLGDLQFKGVDLWVPEGSTRRRLEDVRIIRNAAISQRDRSVVDGIPTLSPAIALTQLGAVTDDEQLEQAIDDFLRAFDERWLLSTLDRLGARGRPGVSALRRVLNAPHRMQGVTDSWMERLLARLAAQPDLPPVELQCEVVIDGKRYRVDVGYPSIRLGLEAHSRAFHFGPSKEDADNVRDLAFASVGWQLLYVTWRQIQDPEGCADQIARIARQRWQDLGLVS